MRGELCWRKWKLGSGETGGVISTNRLLVNDGVGTDSLHGGLLLGDWGSRHFALVLEANRSTLVSQGIAYCGIRGFLIVMLGGLGMQRCQGSQGSQGSQEAKRTGKAERNEKAWLLFKY